MEAYIFAGYALYWGCFLSQIKVKHAPNVKTSLQNAAQVGNDTFEGISACTDKNGAPGRNAKHIMSLGSTFPGTKT